jgi:SIR2-like domain
MSMNASLPATAKMPLWGDLSRLLAEELADYSPTSVLDAISAYEHEFGRAHLIERLAELLHQKDAQPGIAHREFCGLSFDIVCTTNFDFLLERQYDLVPKPVYPVVDEDQLSINIGSPGTLLLKLHGDLRYPKRLVVTEADYDGFLSNYPLIATYLANQLITKTAVFIGYSLDDPDFRQIWQVVSNRLGKTRRMAYAIVVNARPSDIARFERRGVKVVNLPGTRERYGEVLAEAFAELREHVRNNIVSASKVIEEKPLQELLLPRNSTSHLCFFSLPLDVLPFYRERVFPIAEEAGFVPVTAADFITPGDSINAKIDTLIDRAVIMIVELSSKWTRAELAMAIARTREDVTHSHRRALTLILIAPSVEQIPPWVSCTRFRRHRVRCFNGTGGA